MIERRRKLILTDVDLVLGLITRDPGRDRKNSEGKEGLGLDHLEKILDEEPVEEVIVATNPTVEGEATAHFIGDLCRTREIRASRIAHGVPVGGELEFVDGGTLSHAFAGRTAIEGI